MPLETGTKPGSPGFERNIKEMVASGHPQKQAVAAAYSAAGETKDEDVPDEDDTSTSDADDPNIAPAVAETEVHALNRVPASNPPIAPTTVHQPVNTYEDPGFRNPTPDSAAGRQVGPSLGQQNATARAYWAGRR